MFITINTMSSNFVRTISDDRLEHISTILRQALNKCEAAVPTDWNDPNQDPDLTYPAAVGASRVVLSSVLHELSQAGVAFPTLGAEDQLTRIPF